MPLLSKPASATYLSLIYITVGALIDVWSGVWYWYLTRNPPMYESTWFWCHGLLLTGFVILLIGLAVGRIGRSARHAELPPEEVTPAAAQVAQTAAAHPDVTVVPPTALPVPQAPAVTAAPAAQRW